MKYYKSISAREKQSIFNIIKAISLADKLSEKKLRRIFFSYPAGNDQIIPRTLVRQAYEDFKKKGLINLPSQQEKKLYQALKRKQIRTLSGITPVAVFTKPFPCPAKCIFCPSDVRMPKSYLSSEPGAMRAERNKFDPYLQTFNRLVAFNNLGHPTDKVELIVLGGTWSAYPQTYQRWFIKRCFQAMNDFDGSRWQQPISVKGDLPYEESLLKKIDDNQVRGAYNKIVAKALYAKRKQVEKEKASWQELFQVHRQNEQAHSRCVGLTIETRPDQIDKEEVIRLRKLGATKVQIGIQSLNDEVLRKNKRGHKVVKTQEALALLRQTGFKIHVHWMANLYGSTPQKDIADYKKIFSDINIRPDEIKIYPCSLIKTAELYDYYIKGLWQPFTKAELMTVLKETMRLTPRYCRISRMIRDISAGDIVVGNKESHLRQEVERQLKKEGLASSDIRGREIRGKKLTISSLRLKKTFYQTSVSKEIFIEYATAEDRIAGFLRLSLPKVKALVSELANAAIIRELHIYGPSVGIGKKTKEKVQHQGLGKKLLQKAREIAKKKHFEKLAVISAVGTREYYRKNGFSDGELYQYLYL